MKVMMDISLYPLSDDFIPPIQDVIERLQQHNGVAVVRNQMSTQLTGEFEDVMAAFNQEVKTTFERTPKAVFVIKILNNPIGS